MLVSVIIPSFNQGKYISETIESCLAQSYRPIQILVLDGGSTDDTISILKSFDCQELEWWSEPDNGVVEAVNKGLARARGDILTIQSSDDTFLPGAIEAAVAAFNTHPKTGLVFCDVEIIDQDSNPHGSHVLGEFDFCNYIGRLQYIPQPGAFFTRSAMVATGAWREHVSYVADADFWIRLIRQFPVHKLSQRLAQYRHHPEQRNTQKASIARDWEIAISDLILNADLSARERRFARMGIHLAHHKYADERQWIKRTIALYKAALTNPFCISHPAFPKRDLLPGRQPIWSFLSRIKRRLGFNPRFD